MANKGNFNFEKGGSGGSPQKDGKNNVNNGGSADGNSKINLNKQTPEELENGIEVDAYGNPVHPIRTPQPEEPASVDMPDLSEEAIKAGIEDGPEEPRKKGYAWLWALIGIAIVLAFLGMIFLNRSAKEEDGASTIPAETVLSSADSVAVDDSASAVANEAVENAGAEAGNVLDKAVGAVSEAAGSVADAAGDAANAAKEAAANAADVAKDAASKAAQEIAPKAAKEAASKAAREIAPQAAKEAAAKAVGAVTGSVETEALNAIRGDYGNGLVRKEKLGASYPEIQSRINQLKRAGKF